MKKIAFAFLIITILSGFCSLNAQIITTIAGDGMAGYSGDGGPATAAEIFFAPGVAVDGSGNMYIADMGNNRIRKVNPASGGVISTIAGNDTAGYSGDGGQATAAELNYTSGVAVDGSGNVYIADEHNYCVRKVATSGIISTIAGNGTGGYSGDGGAATAAELSYPGGIAVDGSGNVYIADQVNNRIRKVNTSGIISTIAGIDSAGYNGDGGQATAAKLYSPFGIAVDGSGNVYIADVYNNRIRKVNTSGIISTIAGNGTPGFSGDGGTAIAAELAYPAGVTLDNSGNVYIADNGNQRIRTVNTFGVISTIAGNGTAGYSGDGGVATVAELNYPAGVAVDGSGDVYIADQYNNRIRKVGTGNLSVAAPPMLPAEGITVFPNPATTQITIQFNNNAILSGTEGLLIITDLLGQTMYTQPLTINCKLLTVNCSSFPPGMYLLKINGAQVRKFLKE